MPRRHIRTLTAHDHQAVRLACQFGVLDRQDLAQWVWPGMEPRHAYPRIDSLTRAGYLQLARWGPQMLVMVTARGARLAGLGLRSSVRTRPSQYEHLVQTARLAWVALARNGGTWLSERQLRSQRRGVGVYPDGVLVLDGRERAYELELTPKLDLRDYRAKFSAYCGLSYERIVYVVGTRAIGEWVRGQAESVGMDDWLVVVPLAAVLDDLERARRALLELGGVTRARSLGRPEQARALSAAPEGWAT
jgi:hypothetical protein